MFPCKNARMTFRIIMLQITISAALLLQPLELRAADTILPEGTRISLQLNDDLSTKSNSEGDAFTAIVMAPVNSGDKIVIPKGSVVNGSISRMIRPSRFRGKAGMYLLFQSISIPGRGQLPIFATATRINSPGSGDVGIEGRIEGKGSGESAGKIVAPALVGAGIGTIAGGGKGAAIGTGAGIGIGLATVFTSRGKHLELRRGSTMDIALDRPLAVPSE